MSDESTLDEQPPVVVGSFADEQIAVFHPIRGVLYGFLIGFGIAVYLIIFKVISLTIVTPIIVIVLFALLGGLWGRFGPPKPAKATS